MSKTQSEMIAEAIAWGIMSKINEPDWKKSTMTGRVEIIKIELLTRQKKRMRELLKQVRVDA